MSFDDSVIYSTQYLPNDWGNIELGEIADVLSGFAFKSNYFVDQGIPVIKIKNIEPPYVTLDDVQYVSKEIAEQQKKYLLKYNDILISLTGSNITQLASVVGKVGRVRIKNQPMLLNQRVGKVYVTDPEKYDEQFLYYVISRNEVKYQLASMAGGSANQANISPKQIKQLQIPFPPLIEQKTIAQLLAALDDKIELNNVINKNLEEIGQALFKRWFVDFEFPNENGEPYKSSGGEFEESELGLIPKGWRVQSLQRICEFRKGFSYKGKYLSEFGTPMINLGNVSPDGSFKFDSVKYYSDNSFKEHHTVKPGDIVIANTDITQKRDVIGTPVIVPNLNSEKIIISHHITALKNLKLPGLFVYHLLKTDSCKNRLKSFATGTTVLALPKDALPNFTFVCPNYELIMNFNKIVTPIFQQIGDLNRESILLMKIRGTLLPKLMSGEIRVPIEQS
ncbi:restriction endonuclease subunit S [Paenibacillus chartarius]|uniref:Restriction endonuclease subunit S n=1 Tax=Paenibacillus chartarius TaxID=747481 RepID=A0ABV6DQY4_9BACL